MNGLQSSWFVSNASAKLFPDKRFSSFTNFLPQQLNLDGQGEVVNSEISSSSMYQKLQNGNSCFLQEKFRRLSKTYYLEPGLYRFITDTLEAMKILNHGRHKNSESSIIAKVSRRTRKVETCL